MIESRCGLICEGCEYRADMGCPGCVHMSKPFWGDSCEVKSCCEGKGNAHCGECAEFPCATLKKFAYDMGEESDGGKRIEQCKGWAKA